jgi:competence protein ComEA
MSQKTKYAIYVTIITIIMMVSYYFVIYTPTPQGVVLVREPIEEQYIIETKEHTQVYVQQYTQNQLQKIKVHITGEVINPGVYELYYGSRVINVVELAGGSTYRADLDKINLAGVVTDGQQIRIPKIGEINQGNSTTDSTYVQNNYNETASGIININTATREQLITLPNIGPARADTIISHREINGPFRQIEDIKDVGGIGMAIFESLRMLITV